MTTTPSPQEHGPHPEDRIGCQMRCACGARITWPQGREGRIDRCADSGIDWQRRSR